MVVAKNNAIHSILSTDKVIEAVSIFAFPALMLLWAITSYL